MQHHLPLELAQAVLSEKKAISATEDDVYGSIRNGVSYQKDGNFSRWRVRFYIIDDYVRAQLLHNPTKNVLVALDHHVGRSKNPDGSIVEPGYHFDVMPPLSLQPTKIKIHCGSLPDDGLEVFRYVCFMWKICLSQATTKRLR